MDDIMLRVDNVSKQYKLGQIGGTTLRDELQRLDAKIRHREDPTRRIGEMNYAKGETFMALDGVSFDVQRGERVGIIGRNGAGKSTLLKLISRVTAPTSGAIGLNGRVASMLEVGTGFHPELTGRENVYMNGAILGMTRREIDAKLEDIIEFSECRQFIDTPVKRYSSGMYVKLAFSVAAHLESEIMIMDEVLAVGDMAFQKKCLKKMSDVSREGGRTILYVSHNMNTIRQLCDRVVVLDHGHMAFDGGVEEGIGAYMETGVDKRLHYDYREMGVPSTQKATLRMLWLDICGRDTNRYERGERIEFRLRCAATEDIGDVWLRYEVFSADGNVVGTAFSGERFSAKAGETLDIDLSMGTASFAPGRYSSAALLFETDGYGGQVPLHRVEPALSFEIVERDEDLVWLHRWWGHVHLDDVAVSNIAVHYQ